MRAVVMGGGGGLALGDAADPSPGPGEVLIAVRAAGLNRADLAARAGLYPRRSPVAGMELAGEVAAVGDGVTGLAGGDRVMAMAPGAFAELAVVDHRLAVPVPDRLSWEEAAATPLTFITAHDALVTHGALQAGEAVLVHAAPSGVGVAAVQIARHRRAGLVLGTSRSAAKLRPLADLGLDVAVDTTTTDFADAVLGATDQRGADVIVDTVGASALAGNLACAAVRARWVGVGRLGGRRAELDLDELARKRVTLVGVTFRTRTRDEHAEVVRRFADDLLPALADGRLRPVVHEVLDLAQAAEAEDRMAADRHVGKIVLRVS